MRKSLKILKRITCMLGILFIVLGVVPIPEISQVSEASAATLSLPNFTSVDLFDSLGQDEGGEVGGEAGGAGDSGSADSSGAEETLDTEGGSAEESPADAAQEEPVETTEPTEESEGEPVEETEGETTEEAGEECLCEPSEENPDCLIAEAPAEEEDLCPEDLDKTEPGVCGCGVPDLDANEDGVVDCVEEEDDDEEAAAIKEIINVMVAADAVLTDENNETIPLGSEDAAEVLSSADPYFTRGTDKYCYVANGICDSSCAYCNGTAGTSGTPTTTPIQDAIDEVEANGMPGDGTVYVLPGGSAYFENLVIDIDGLILMGDPGNTTEAGVGASAPVLSGDSNDLTLDVGINVLGDNVTIIGFVIENYFIGIQLNPTGSTNFEANNNTIQDNTIGVQSYNSIPGIVLNYNDFENNDFAIYNVDDEEPGGGGTQYIHAEYNYWGCSQGPVVAVYARECTGSGPGRVCQWVWHYYQWASGDWKNPTELVGFDPETEDCECLYGGKFLHWNHAAFNWSPYKIILDPVAAGIEHFCGDGTVDDGEQCDDGNTSDNDGCSSTCVAEYCGDGVIQPPEICDGSVGVEPGQTCSTNCDAIHFCGDGAINQPSEQCDGSDGVGEGQTCSGNCLLLYCGDNAVNQDFEECDGSDGVGEGQSCSASCELLACGDGVVNQDSEQCDGEDGVAEGQTCSQSCEILYCGDGFLNQESEECDGQDGITAGVTTCSAECTLENVPPNCGDGTLQVDEECEAGLPLPEGAPEGAVCNPQTCSLEYCGDGIVQVSLDEQCDGAAGVVPGEQTCSASCELLTCGDGVVNQEWEACDGEDGVTEGQTCSQSCEILYCGDGEVNQESEDCDGEEWCTEECHYKEIASLLIDPYCINTTTLRWTIENPNSFPVPDVHAVLDGVPSVDGLVNPGTTVVGNTGDGPASHTLSLTWPGGSASQSSNEDCSGGGGGGGGGGGAPVPAGVIPVTGAGGPIEELLIIPVTGVDLGMQLAGFQNLFLYMGLMLFGITMVLEGMTKKIEF